jgi:sporulation protein YlmC with PRC-barrel domain
MEQEIRMTSSSDDAVLSMLSHSGQTVASPDEDIRGRKVKDKDGNDLGKVDDLLIDEREGKVRLMLVEHGGFLGLGRTKSFIPVAAINRISGDEVHINHSRQHVASGPGYDPELVQDKAYLGAHYDHYISGPWGAGYGFPGFPGSPDYPLGPNTR